MEIFSPIPVFIVTISYGIPKNKTEDNPGGLSPKPVAYISHFDFYVT